MKIFIIGSLSFKEKMKSIKVDLEKMGHQVELCPSVSLDESKELWNDIKTRSKTEFAKLGTERNLKNFNTIRNSEAILLVNLNKNGIDGYIGANSLMELAVAFEHGKKIFILNEPPKDFFAEEELSYMNTVVINSDLSLIK
jgi:hypothetical protein